MKTLRVLMMADVPPDPNRGAAGTEVQTAQALRTLGHHVDTLWADDLGRRIQHGNLHLLLELPRTYERAAVRALRAHEYDVVHINQPHGYRAARAIHRLSPGTAVIHRSHGLELHVDEVLEPRRSDERSSARRIASSVLAALLARHSNATARVMDGHIVSSSLDADFLASRMHVSREKIAVIAQGVPDEYVSAPLVPFTRERQKRVLYAGQFALPKAPEVTAEAINRLAARDEELRFTWVCERAHHENVRSLLSATAIARTELLHWVGQDELRSIYDAHGIFLFPSYFEGFGKAFLEAMSRGLCVVASDVGGMHDLIAHGRSGILVPAGDAEAVADAAIVLAADFARAAAMSADAARTARQFTWERVARELAGFYAARVEARRAVGR